MQQPGEFSLHKLINNVCSILLLTWRMRGFKEEVLCPGSFTHIQMYTTCKPQNKNWNSELWRLIHLLIGNLNPCLQYTPKATEFNSSCTVPERTVCFSCFFAWGLWFKTHYSFHIQMDVSHYLSIRDSNSPSSFPNTYFALTSPRSSSFTAALDLYTDVSLFYL